MKGDPQIIEALNDVLTAELTAINQYFVHHKMCENWGYQRLSKQKREESIGEMKDADAVLERILYFDGVPNMQRLNAVSVGEDPIEHGIGIHTGEVLAGSVGSAERLSYSMIGDTVNIASRIQTLNKKFGTDILLSGETKSFLKKGKFELATLGEATLKGKSQVVEIYKLS